MPTPKKGPRLGASASHQRKILANLSSQLIFNRSLKTTEAKAKTLQPYFESLSRRRRAVPSTIAASYRARSLIATPFTSYSMSSHRNSIQSVMAVTPGLPVSVTARVITPRCA